MSEFAFTVGDMVAHRASGEVGVVVERRKRCEAIIEYRLSTGFHESSYARSAAEVEAGKLWVQEMVLRIYVEPQKFARSATEAVA